MKTKEYDSDAVARARTWDHLVNSEVLYQLSYDGWMYLKINRGNIIWLSLRSQKAREPMNDDIMSGIDTLSPIAAVC